MVEAQIKQVDRFRRTVMVKTADGRELSLRIGDDTDIEVMEWETAGNEPGSLEDLHEGYLVDVDFTEADSGCACHSLVCIS
ncbi:MAG: hypothetical protein ACE5JS_02660 [Nitrospinota bacterium]